MSIELDLDTIYRYDNHENIPWNIGEYQPMKHYQSPSKGNFQTERYVTKRGFYMDPHIKNVKDLPSPTHYPSKTLFDQTQNQKQSKRIKINPRLRKGTYLQILQRQNKKIKSAVGSYNLEKTQKQIKQELKREVKRQRKVKYGPVPSFYEDIQSLSLEIPGPGNYNPHLSIQHFHKQRMTPEKWVDKHRKQSKHFLKKKRKEPGPPSYRPASAGTFDRKKIQLKFDRKKRKNSFDKGFGTDAKFEYTRVNKKKIKQKRPAPTRYNLTINWKRKSENKLVYQRQLSTRSVSVYH